MPEISKTVDQALALLEDLGERGPASALELARRVPVNRTVAHRLLATLEARRFVSRADDGRYRLGSALLTLGGHVDESVREAARPGMAQLAEAFAETVVLSVADQDDAVALDQVLAVGRMVRVQYQPGFRHSLGLAAHGLAILAFSPSQTVERVAASATSPRALRRSLTVVRERGYAVTHDQLQFGASGLAAPIRDSEGWAQASLGVVAPVNRFPDEALLARATCAAAEQASRRLAIGARARPREHALR
ncbi:MAG TPA: IclR family transcriptional regulator [Egibacteraceae bacterium]|nr:IclR family transcriptional regulator [Egibacteraceae bacterium]